VGSRTTFHGASVIGSSGVARPADHGGAAEASRRNSPRSPQNCPAFIEKWRQKKARHPLEGLFPMLVPRIVAALSVALVLGVFGPARAVTIDVGTQQATYTGNTRGFTFVAPQDLRITGLSVPTSASTANFDVAVLFIDSLLNFPTTGSAFSTAYVARDRSAAITGLSIFVPAGQRIGILGSRGASATNSYGAVGPTVSLLGSPVRLDRLVMQARLRSALPSSTTLFGSPSGRIGRVLVEVEPVPTPVPLPAGIVLALLGGGCLLMLRRRSA
jgi:hypothetical protein